MKVLQINTVFRNGGSTGRIAYDLMQIQKQKGIEAFVAYGYETGASHEDNTLCLQSIIRRKINILRTRIFDHHGFYNEAETRKLIRWMDEMKPDIIHLHNIHNHYVNVKMLFDYIKQYDIPVIWTLHDCWTMTGHCSHFDFEGCIKWKIGCHNCTLLKNYPPTWFFDRTSRNYNDKKNAFNGVKNLILVSPSLWLSDVTRESFLRFYPVRVINNGIDVEIFNPSIVDNSNYNIKKKYGIEGKKMILALMSTWQKNKGIEYITKLPKYLTEKEVLVVVGLQKNQLRNLPKDRCIGISRTDSIHELAAYYASADVFINPTLEDTFPTTNLESLASGTPVVTFRTGGSVESIIDDSHQYTTDGVYESDLGYVVPQCDFEAMLSCIRAVTHRGKEYYQMKCVHKALNFYEKKTQYMKYIELYNEILKK